MRKRRNRFSLTRVASSTGRVATKQFPISSSLALAVTAAVLMLGYAQTGHAQFSKATQILLTRGLQLQGLVQPADSFHLDIYSNANYNTINWGFTSAPDLMGPAPGVPWARWVSDPTQLPPLPGEESYLSQLVCLSLSDEPYLDTPNDFADML